MNYKLLLPTYRTRFRFVADRLERYAPEGGFPDALHLGAGEGDYDPMLAGFCQQLLSCDANASEIAFAERLNAGVPGLRYGVYDAQALALETASFSLVVAVDVLEHVLDPARMVAEFARVLRSGGLGLLTFPQRYFPFTYDPLHALLGRRILPLGAFGYGHEKLIDPADFERWAAQNGLEVVERIPLSGYLVGLTEMYWPGFAQRLLKANADNGAGDRASANTLRPTTSEPRLVAWTDAWIRLDRSLFGRSSRSVGVAYVLRKRRSGE